jgi:hypothetical protein
MAVMKIDVATITVQDHDSLLVAWRIHGGIGSLVGRFVVRERLTKSQLRRLPKALRKRLEYADDSIAFCERLFLLEDPRRG